LTLWLNRKNNKKIKLKVC